MSRINAPRQAPFLPSDTETRMAFLQAVQGPLQKLWEPTTPKPGARNSPWSVDLVYSLFIFRQPGSPCHPQTKTRPASARGTPRTCAERAPELRRRVRLGTFSIWSPHRAECLDPPAPHPSTSTSSPSEPRHGTGAGRGFGGTAGIHQNRTKTALDLII